MKTKLNSINSRGLFFLTAIAVAVIGTYKIDGQTENINTTKSTDEKIVAAIEASNYTNVYFWPLFQGASDNRQQTIQELLKIFNDPKSQVFPAKCYSAYYLGQIRASEATDSLAAQITLRGHEHGLEEPLGGYEPAVTALIAIGNPSIPAVIRNLAESDDAKVRELSLMVLYRIEDDKDIVQLRLQKALKAEKDSRKQARLQAALKALAETSFGN